MVSDFGAYEELALIETVENKCNARWPFLLAAAIAAAWCLSGAFA